MIFSEYARIVWQKKFWFLLTVLALSSATILDLYVPLFYQSIANRFTRPYSAEVLEALMSDLTGIAGCFAGIWVSWRILEVGIIPLEAGGVAALEKRCFDVLKKQRHAFFENHFSGSLIKQANRFSSSFEIILDWFLFHCYQNLLAVTISFAIFHHQQAQFARYFLIWVSAFLGWNILYSIWKLRFDKDVARWDSKLGGVYSDAISNMVMVKSFALERSEQSKVEQTADTIYRKKKIAWILMFVSFAVQGILTFGIELILVWLMIEKWKLGNFAVGEFVLFQSILLMLIQRLWEFGRNFRTFFTAVADAAEMAEIFRSSDIESDSPGARNLEIRKGIVEFRNLSFDYGGKNPQAPGLFQNFCLRIQAGEKIALVGHSGSGKTTLTKLLFRFCEPGAGVILIDGVDFRRYTLESLRRQISLVPQQPELFHRSIRENITLGTTTGESRLHEVMRQSRCRDFVNALPQGLDTVVGERGVKLSGGEKQRIAIARALLENAPVLVLDEATSALDSVTESSIQQAILELMNNRTTIVIAHRLSTILRMDRILVLDNGTIVEQGTHEQLLQIKGRYYRMWQHQSGDFLQTRNNTPP